MTEYIKREDLLKFPIRVDHYNKEHCSEDFISGIEFVMDFAQAIPAADVEPVKHSKWIPITDFV